MLAVIMKKKHRRTQHFVSNMHYLVTSTRVLLLMMCIKATSITNLAAQPPPNSINANIEYFTYYNPDPGAIPSMPIGANTASRGIIFLSSPLRNIDPTISGTSTAFLIRTFRNDNKICMCLTGHQIKIVFRNGSEPVINSPVPFTSDIYMDFLGRYSIGPDGHYYNYTKKDLTKGYLSSGILKAYYYDKDRGKDIALVLIDKRWLPSASFTMLGYYLGDDDSPLHSINYSLGHPLRYPLRISDSLTITNVTDNYYSTRTRFPYATAVGFSGAPLIKRPLTALESWYVRGVLASSGPSQQWVADVFHPKDSFKLSISPKFTKISVLADAIRENCWQGRKREEILSSGDYKRSVTVDNNENIVPYSQNQSITSTPALSASSAAFTETTSESTVNTYLKANICTISGFILPSKMPGTQQDWTVEVLAKQTYLGNGFSYTASGSSEFSVHSVIVPELKSASFASVSKSGTFKKPDTVDNRQPTHIDTRFLVYPNPGPEGIFYLQLPAAANMNATKWYRVEVFSADGTRVLVPGYAKSGDRYRIDVSGLSKGSYVLNVYQKNDNSKMVFSNILLY